MSISLINSWKESFLLFKPSVFKQLLQVTIKSMGTFYHALFRYGWPILMLDLIFYTGKDYFHESIRWSISWRVATVVISTLYIIFMCLAARASVKKKDCAYFRDYFSYCYWPAYNIVGLFHFFRGFDDISLLASVTLWYLIFLILFFTFDGSCNVIKDVSNALKMFIYNLPFWFGVWFIQIAVTLLFMFIIAVFFKIITLIFIGNHHIETSQVMFFLFSLIIGIMTNIVMMPFFINLIRVIYTKRLYDQFSLYFPDKSK